MDARPSPTRLYRAANPPLLRRPLLRCPRERALGTCLVAQWSGRSCHRRMLNAHPPTFCEVSQTFLGELPRAGIEGRQAEEQSPHLVFGNLAQGDLQPHIIIVSFRISYSERSSHLTGGGSLDKTSRWTSGGDHTILC